jgi:hypothetical protein
MVYSLLVADLAVPPFVITIMVRIEYVIITRFHKGKCTLWYTPLKLVLADIAHSV